MLDNESDTLSVGHCQLITIARIFLCTLPAIVLDEATSSLEPCTEAETVKVMKN